jgi:AcrR family transcriptional regulator
MSEEVTRSRHARGRLSAARERALLEVALALLAEVGYDRMSVDELARRAHTSKATLYRRWPRKADLVAAALLCHKADAQKPPPAATLREDLIAVVTFLSQEITANRSLTQGLLTAICTDQYLGALVKLQGAGAMEQDMACIITRAIERGELSPQSAENTATAAEVVHALITNRLLLSRTPLDAGFIEHLVDAILLPILRSA